MSEYNASDTRHIKRAAKAAKVEEADRGHIIAKLMSDPPGRAFMYSLLARCHAYHTSFSANALTMAFQEGERNIGIQFQLDCAKYAPDQYIAMLREATDKEVADGRRDSGRSTNGNGRDSGPEPDAGPISAEYTPGDGDGDAGDEAGS